ncbi:MAG TPA: FkbM family methyltransferase [Ideonella sp.]|nr:FkbM family methyltransferase [Ideonella sp.]
MAAALPRFDDQAAWGAYAPAAWVRALLAACHAVPGRVPALHRLVIWLRRPVKYGVAHPLDVMQWGLKLRLLPRGNMSDAKLLFAPQFFDRAELALLAERLPPGGTFVDVGANAGIYSFWAHHCMRGRGRILAVEPDPEMRRRLRFNLDSNGLSNVELAPVALSDRQGTAALLLNLSQRGENTLALEEASAAGGDRMALTVETDTLTHLLQAHGMARIDALKIDIEGHEPPVLRHFYAHAPEALWPRLVIVEFKQQTSEAITALFEGCGYRRLLATRLNWAFERDPSR